MIGDKKVIGICMTKIQDTSRSRTISYFHEEAKRLGYKLLIFNSSFDFYDGLEEDIGAAGIYDFINFEIVDAIIILCSGFLDKTVYEKIIKNATEAGKPVILEDQNFDGCYTVINHYEETFRELMNHVIKDHGITDTHFIAGIKNNAYSDSRIEVYKSVLAENGLKFDDSMVDYGDFWEGPTDVVIDKLVKENRLPKAFFCANDSMAIAACKRLEKHGYKVPGDILVTGFDGSKMSEFALPKISTCVLDRVAFAKKCMAILTDIFDGKKPEKVHKNHYILRLSDSCGCVNKNIIDFRQMAEESYYMVTNMIGHEHILFNDIIFRLNYDGMNNNAFYSVLPKILNHDACIAFKPSFITTALGVSDVDNTSVKKLMAIYSVSRNNAGTTPAAQFDYKNMVPDLKEWAEEDSVYIISSIQVGKVICGYYEDKTNDIIKNAPSINRIYNLINMLVHMAVSDLRQRFFKIGRGSDSLFDSVTELPNLYGATRWFENFMEAEENKDKLFTVSLYELPKYRFILENYGFDEIEATVCFVAETLKLANKHDCYIAHISEDEFIVINAYDNSSQIGGTIDSAINIFYSFIEQYNYTNGKEYLVEVRNGCVVSEVRQNKRLETLIKDATTELYNNIAIYGTLPAKKGEIVSSKDEYEMFKVLVSKNMFHYHFQPIVSAKDGEIVAYEALMRTDSVIGFSPIKVLDIAKEYHRLYDVEKATIFNVMEYYKSNIEAFYGRKVFVNCIPGNSIKHEDNEIVKERFASLIDNFVFEITEQDTITDKELIRIRSIGNDNSNNNIAIDDYGVGHSNAVNLINYTPEIVKIDRFLITDIHLDSSKQILVRSIIDMAKINNIKVLAEGVETGEELKKVIELGVDYIQGYYTGRPIAEPIAEIDEKIKGEIISASNRL